VGVAGGFGGSVGPSAVVVGDREGDAALGFTVTATAGWVINPIVLSQQAKGWVGNHTCSEYCLDETTLEVLGSFDLFPKALAASLDRSASGLGGGPKGRSAVASRVRTKAAMGCLGFHFYFIG
jgi:hypothetical protein